MGARVRSLVVVVATIIISFSPRILSHAQAETVPPAETPMAERMTPQSHEPSAEPEKLSCFRTDGGHDGLEEQTKTILDEPLEFGKTFINSASVNAAIEGGDTVETGIVPVLLILQAGERNLMATGAVFTDAVQATRNNAAVCDSKLLGIVEIGEMIYESEEKLILEFEHSERVAEILFAETEVLEACRNSIAVPDPRSQGLLADCAFLLSTKASLSGDAQLNWSYSLPIAEWEGITVYNSRVVGLELPFAQLTGGVPAYLGALSSLETLDLGGNQLSGRIPSSLGNLKSLKTLSLYNNHLTGSIPPELGNLARLEIMHLFGNQLTGRISPAFGLLTNLQQVSLADNHLTGSIPPELGNLEELQQLSLFKNQLTGPIPDSLGNLTNLKWLSLSDNKLTGSIPASLGRLTNIRSMALARNNLHGPIPSSLSLASLTDLSRLTLAGNPLTGCILPSLHRTKNSDLWLLRLPDCELSFDEARSDSIELDYKDLFRYNEVHIGKIVYFMSKVVQVIEEDGRYYLRANVTKTLQGNWDNTVLFHVEKPSLRFLEDDIVEFVAEVEGLKTYESIFGQTITIPALSVIQFRLIEK